MLREALANPDRRAAIISGFQQRVWELNAVGPEAERVRVLKELAYDLDYYQPEPAARRENPSLFGDERLEQEILAALRKLGAQGKAA